LQANTTHAVEQIEADPTLTSPEVRYLVDFIRASQRGVILRRPTRRTEELVATNEAGTHRRERAVPVSRARRGARAGARRHDCGGEGRDVSGADRCGAAARRGDPLDFARPARQVHLGAEG